MTLPTHAFRRVSCPGFALIRNNQLYGLIKDMQHPEYNRLVPVGGALRATPTGMTTLINDYRAPAESFEDGYALRFAVPPVYVPEVAKWFAHRKDRDTDMSRMLLVSLYHETGVLTRHEVGQAQQTLAGYTRGDNKTTDYLTELYNVTFPGSTMEKLRRLSDDPRSDFWFVTAAEINQGLMRRGGGFTMRIHTVATSLLNPSERLPLDD